MCSKPAGLICTTGLRSENLPASTADRGAPAGGPIGKLARAAGWVHASKHTAPRPRRSGALATSLCSFSPETGPNNRYRLRFVSPRSQPPSGSRFPSILRRRLSTSLIQPASRRLRRVVAHHSGLPWSQLLSILTGIAGAMLEDVRLAVDREDDRTLIGMRAECRVSIKPDYGVLSQLRVDGLPPPVPPCTISASRLLHRRGLRVRPTAPLRSLNRFLPERAHARRIPVNIAPSRSGANRLRPDRGSSRIHRRPARPRADARVPVPDAAVGDGEHLGLAGGVADQVTAITADHRRSPVSTMSISRLPYREQPSRSRQSSTRTPTP